jgi:hypothetical protein
MPSLFDITDTQLLVARIQQITPDTPAQWGKMNASQMLAHCCVPLQVAFGEVKLKKSLIGTLFGWYFKRQLAKTDKPWDKNMPTDNAFIMTGTNPDFEAKRAQLIELIHRFVKVGPDGISKDPHPFFGSMTPQEWDAIQTNHLDHHLRQFGV